MTTLQKNTLNERVYQDLLDLLISGEIPMGTQLDERDLSERLGVSRTPLRGAIARLATEELVEYFPYRGHIVKEFTAQKVRNLYEVRRVLETLAIERAIPKMSDEDIDRIRRILDTILDTVHRDDMQAFADADRAFHSAIIEKAENETLTNALDRLSLQIQIARTIANRDPQLVERTMKERPLILNALQERNIELAKRLIGEHIDGVANALVDQIEAHENMMIAKARHQRR